MLPIIIKQTISIISFINIRYKSQNDYVVIFFQFPSLQIGSFIINVKYKSQSGYVVILFQFSIHFILVHSFPYLRGYLKTVYFLILPTFFFRKLNPLIYIYNGYSVMFAYIHIHHNHQQPYYQQHQSYHNYIPIILHQYLNYITAISQPYHNHIRFIDNLISTNMEYFTEGSYTFLSSNHIELSPSKFYGIEKKFHIPTLCIPTNMQYFIEGSSLTSKTKTFLSSDHIELSSSKFCGIEMKLHIPSQFLSIKFLREMGLATLN